MQNQALEQDFENEIERKNANNKQVGQIISSINNIYQTCQTLAQMQNKSKAVASIQDKDGEDNQTMVKNLQLKLDDAKNKISELTDVLTHLHSDKTIELYYEESA